MSIIVKLNKVMIFWLFICIIACSSKSTNTSNGNKECKEITSTLCALAYSCSSADEKASEYFKTIFDESKDYCYATYYNMFCDKVCNYDIPFSSSAYEECEKSMVKADCPEFYSTKSYEKCRNVCISSSTEDATDAIEEIVSDIEKIDTEPFQEIEEEKQHTDYIETVKDQEQEDFIIPDIIIDLFEDAVQFEKIEDIADVQEIFDVKFDKGSDVLEGIICDQSICEPGNKCCIKVSEGITTKECVPVEQSCEGTLILSCDGGEDCDGGSDHCCATMNVDKLKKDKVLEFSTECLEKCSPPSTYEVCSSSNDCITTNKCCLPYFGSPKGVCINSLLATFCPFVD